MTLLGPRRHEREILDRPGQDPEALARSLAHVSAVNRWLGGDRALRLHLRRVYDEAEGVPAILDVGVGDGAMLRRLERDAPDGTRFVGVDIHPGVARLARRRSRSTPGLHVVRADGLRLPFPDGAFSAVTCTLTLHHFRRDAAVDLLREMARVARKRVLVNDLERSLPSYLGARMLAGTVWRDCPITRHDGPLSVLRSFSPGGLRELARAAGLTDVEIRRRFPFRLVLDARPPGGGPLREGSRA